MKKLVEILRYVGEHHIKPIIVVPIAAMILMATPIFVLSGKYEPAFIGACSAIGLASALSFVVAGHELGAEKVLYYAISAVCLALWLIVLMI